MFKALIFPALFLMLLTVHTAYATEPADEVMKKCQDKHPEWYQCSTDADCVVSLDPCGWPVLGVNQIHKSRSEICTRQAGAFIDCPMWKNTEENKMAATCQKGTCVAIKASEIPVKPPLPNDSSPPNP